MNVRYRDFKYNELRPYEDTQSWRGARNTCLCGNAPKVYGISDDYGVIGLQIRCEACGMRSPVIENDYRITNAGKRPNLYPEAWGIWNKITISTKSNHADARVYGSPYATPAWKN